jgi:hypothetical protein
MMERPKVPRNQLTDLTIPEGDRRYLIECDTDEEAYALQVKAIRAVRNLWDYQCASLID